MSTETEAARLRSLHSYDILDTAPEEAFDRLTTLAQQLFDTPIAVVSLIDAERQWFKSILGLDGEETSRDVAFCAHAIEMEPGSVMVVEDATKDARFAANPLVTGSPDVRFYAGAVLTSSDGENLGTLCVIDDKPRPSPTPAELAKLKVLAAAVMDQIELRRARRRAERKTHVLEMAERLAGVGHWRFDLPSGRLEWSDELYRIHGLTRDTFDPALGTALNYYAPADADRVQSLMADAVNTGRGFDFEMPIRREDGEIREVACKAACELDDAGAVVALVGVFQDITERKTQERALAASEARYRLIADNASDLIMQCDLRGRISYISPSVLNVTGYAVEDLLGRPALDFIHPDDRSEIEIAVAAQVVSVGQAPSRQVEYRGMRKDGREIWLQASPSLAFDPITGVMCGVTDVIRDVTTRKALEQELRAARAEAEATTAVKSEFLANMSHELRTPLTSIIGFTRLIAAQPELSDISRDHVERVGDASQALLHTVNDVLDFSKLEAGQVTIEPQPTDPVRLCRKALDLFAPQAGAKDLSLKFHSAAPEGLTVDIDPDRVRQILLNLLGNAVKFSAKGGVTLRLAHGRDRLRIEVSDTGPGMSAEQQAKLFQRFADVDGSLTRKNGGTGLGLSICKGLAEAMGGVIGVSSERGVGSRFWIDLPAPAVEAPAQAASPQQAAVAPTQGVRLLVVDDHAANRELVRLFLSGVGVDVTEAASGAAAVEIAGAPTFDAILMDLNMPGMNGTTACAKIRQGDGPNRQTPVLAFTASTEDEVDMAALDAAGFGGFVTKPVNPAGLIKAVARATAEAAETEAEDLRRSA